MYTYQILSELAFSRYVICKYIRQIAHYAVAGKHAWRLQWTRPHTSLSQFSLWIEPEMAPKLRRIQQNVSQNIFDRFSKSKSMIEMVTRY